MNAFPVNSPDVISANIIKARVQPYIKSFFKIFISFDPFPNFFKQLCLDDFACFFIAIESVFIFMNLFQF